MLRRAAVVPCARSARGLRPGENGSVQRSRHSYRKFAGRLGGRALRPAAHARRVRPCRVSSSHSPQPHRAFRCDVAACPSRVLASSRARPVPRSLSRSSQHAGVPFYDTAGAFATSSRKDGKMPLPSRRGRQHGNMAEGFCWRASKTISKITHAFCLSASQKVRPRGQQDVARLCAEERAGRPVQSTKRVRVARHQPEQDRIASDARTSMGVCLLRRHSARRRRGRAQCAAPSGRDGGIREGAGNLSAGKGRKVTGGWVGVADQDGKQSTTPMAFVATLACERTRL